MTRLGKVGASKAETWTQNQMWIGPGQGPVISSV